jgi:hypothetical protein
MLGDGRARRVPAHAGLDRRGGRLSGDGFHHGVEGEGHGRLSVAHHQDTNQ